MEAKVEKIVNGGNGLIHAEGKTGFIPYVIPNEIVDFSIDRTKGNIFFAKLNTVIQESPLRIEAKCPYYMECGGCSFQHLDYNEEQKIKTEIVKELFFKFAKLDIKKLKFISSHEWHYRNSIKIHLRNGNWGFKAAESNNVIPINECLLADQKLNLEIHKLKEEKSYNDGDTVHVYVNENGEIQKALIKGKFSPLGFHQVNNEINTKVKQHLEQYKNLANGSILDLYCGNGNLSSLFHQNCQYFDGWDIGAESIQEAKNLYKDKKIQFHRGSIEQALRKIQLQKKSYDLVILDPPRAGLGKNRNTVAKLGSKNILYLSCDPATLARDVATYIEHGYILESILLFDMFPRTKHIETFVHLKKV